ncbi:MAG: hypothetical protein KDA61_17205, partial [Planctomycetales bacterium]|nr:hypothetical protein [Planctomycetales bacterium]
RELLSDESKRGIVHWYAGALLLRLGVRDPHAVSAAIAALSPASLSECSFVMTQVQKAPESITELAEPLAKLVRQLGVPKATASTPHFALQLDAIKCLGSIGVDGLEPLLRLLTHPSNIVSQITAPGEIARMGSVGLRRLIELESKGRIEASVVAMACMIADTQAVSALPLLRNYLAQDAPDRDRASLEELVDKLEQIELQE